MAGKYTSHHPKPPNAPGVNWVERAGGLPGPIDAVMRALMAKGWTQQRAVATGVNHVKKVCSTGRAFGGRVQVSPEAQAKACAAVARWEAMKAEASIVSDERMVVELSRVELAWDESAHPRHGKGQAGGGKFKAKGGATGTAKSKGALTQVPAKPRKADRSQVVRSGRKALKALGRKHAKPRKVDPGKTKDHVAAGLHRIGKAGNAYVDRDGKLFHRAGDGKGEHFASGLPNRPKAQAEPTGKTRPLAGRVRRPAPKGAVPQRKVVEIEAWNRQDDDTRIARMRAGEGPKLPAGFVMYEDGSIGPGRKRKPSGREGRYKR